MKAKVGDTVWFYNGYRDGKKQSGIVVHVFPAGWRGYGFEHYVIEYPTEIEPILVVREEHTITDRPEGRIGLVL